MILAAAGIQCFHFCVYDSLFLVQSNFKAGQIISEQLYSSAVPTHSAAFMAKEDHNVLQIREALKSLGLTDGEKILPDSHPVFKQDCCGSSDATIFPHAENSVWDEVLNSVDILFFSVQKNKIWEILDFRTLW